MHRISELLVFTSNCFCVYSFHYVEPSIIDHVVSMATTSKTGVKCKLLQVEEKLDIKNLSVAA